MKTPDPRFTKEAIDLLVCPPDGRCSNGANQHTGASEDSRHNVGNPSVAGHEQRLRAPELIQDLHREELANQTTAALMGPRGLWFADLMPFLPSIRGSFPKHISLPIVVINNDLGLFFLGTNAEFNAISPGRLVGVNMTHWIAFQID